MAEWFLSERTLHLSDGCRSKEDSTKGPSYLGSKARGIACSAIGQSQET